MRIKQAIVPMVLVAAIAGANPSLALSLAQDAAAKVGAVDPTRDADALATSLRREIGALPAGATAQDIEASIVFVLSQAKYEPATMSTALTAVTSSPETSDALKTAVSNVRLALLSRRLKRGTAAIASGGGYGNGFSSAFSSPIVSIGGGGSSNYSQ